MLHPCGLMERETRVNSNRAETLSSSADAAKPSDEPFANASGKWIDEFIKSSRHVLNKIAPLGKVSREDFALAYKDERLDGHDHRAALVWATDYGRLMNLLGREQVSGLATKTPVSQADLGRLSETMKREMALDTEASGINFQADNLVKTYGRSEAKAIYRSDIIAALGTETSSTYNKEKLLALAKHFDEIRSPGADAVNVDDIKNFYEKVQKENPLIADEFRLQIALTVTEPTRSLSPNAPANSTAPQWLTDFASNATAIADKYGHNHLITRRDLALAISTGAADGAQEDAVAALYRNFNNLSSIIKGTAENTPQTLSREELKSLPNTITQKISHDENFWPPQAPSTIMQQFASDEANALTKEDIRKALGSIDLLNYSEYRSNLQSLLDHFDEAKSARDPKHSGLTLKDIEAFADKCRLKPSAHIVQLELQDTIDSLKQTKDETFSTHLYNEQLPILESIVPEAVRQGHTGDCYFEASLASVALTNPESIRDMIKDNKDGTYTVTFPGASDKPITVSRPNHLEQRLYNHSSKYGTWASVLEKAYGEYRSRYDAVPSQPSANTNGNKEEDQKSSSETPQDVAGHGGIVAPAMKLLTGKDVWEITIAKNIRAMEQAKEKMPEELQEELAQHLGAAFAPGHPHSPVAAVISQFQPGGDWAHSVDGLTKMHAYSITNFEAAGRGGGNVTIRNPHGGTDLEGYTTLSLEKFISNFSFVYVGQY